MKKAVSQKMENYPHAKISHIRCHWPTCPFRASMINLEFPGSVQCRHFPRIPHPFLSFTHFKIWPSSSAIICTFKFSGMVSRSFTITLLPNWWTESSNMFPCSFWKMLWIWSLVPQFINVSTTWFPYLSFVSWKADVNNSSEISSLSSFEASSIFCWTNLKCNEFHIK